MASNSQTVWLRNADGCTCSQTGFSMRNGQLMQGGNPMAPAIAPLNSVSRRTGNILLTPQAWADLYAQQTTLGASGLGNTYSLADQPGNGPTGLVRTAIPGNPKGIPVNNYTIKFNNTGGGATDDIRYVGDWAQSWQLKNPPPTPSPGMTITGSYGAQSLSHATQRQQAAAWAVKSVQVIANNQDYYGNNSIAYIDTRPNGANPTYLPYDLSTLLNADQFNPTIQMVDTPIMLDGITAFQVQIPAGRIVTLNFEIISEGRGQGMLLLNN